MEKHTPRILILVAASLILPGVALAGEKSKWNGWSQSGRDNPDAPHISAVPEANTGLVLLPFVGAVLLFSSLHFARLNAQKSHSFSK
jgi:hypothetical protein